MPWSFDGTLPCRTVCTINNALFELLLRRLEVRTWVHAFIGAYDESANAKVLWSGLAYVMRTCFLGNAVRSLTFNCLSRSVMETKCTFRLNWKLKLGKIAYTPHDAAKRRRQPLVHSTMQVILAGSSSIPCLDMVRRYSATTSSVKGEFQYWTAAREDTQRLIAASLQLTPTLRLIVLSPSKSQ